MSDSGGRKQQDVAERRRDDREVLAGEVTVRFEGLEIVGPGGNISATGLYFVSEAKALVHVEIEGERRLAELVRVETLGSGRIGVAVRFVDDGGS